jgi:hypothetical protein
LLHWISTTFDIQLLEENIHKGGYYYWADVLMLKIIVSALPCDGSKLISVSSEVELSDLIYMQQFMSFYVSHANPPH